MVSDALPEMIPLSEAFIQIWCRRPKEKGKKRTQNEAGMGPPPPPPQSEKPSEPKQRKY